MKVAVYSICGAGELPNIDRYMASCQGADHIYVLLTAPDKAAYDALIDGGATVFRGHFSPFRFDDARNACLARVSPDVDVCIALDMDETLEPKWRYALEASMPLSLPNPTAWWIDFNFNGEVFRQNNRVHTRHGWRWVHPCHEALVPSMSRHQDAVETVPGFTITHRPDPNKPRPNYLEMLAWGQWEDPTSLRMLHYYGRELMFNGLYADAVERFDRYLALREPDYFTAERDLTMQYRAQCAMELPQDD